MVLRLFKGAQPALFIFVPVFAILLWLKYFLIPQPTVLSFEPYPMPFYALLLSWLGGNEIITRILALALLIVISFWLSRLNTKFIILKSRTYLPTFLFLIITSAYLPLQQLNPALFASFFLLYCLEIMFETFKKEGLALKFFQAGIMISFASLFYARSAYLVLILWAGLIILRPFRWREWVFTILGFILPYVFLFSIYYLGGHNLQEHWALILQNFQPEAYDGFLNSYYLVFFGFLLLLLIAASFTMLQINQGLKIYIRKFYRLNFWIFIFTLAVWIGLFSRSAEFIYFMAVPGSYILAQYLLNLRSKILGDILFGILLSLFGLILIFN
jgi:hypothetical protein